MRNKSCKSKGKLAVLGIVYYYKGPTIKDKQNEQIHKHRDIYLRVIKGGIFFNLINRQR